MQYRKYGINGLYRMQLHMRWFIVIVCSTNICDYVLVEIWLTRERSLICTSLFQRVTRRIAIVWIMILFLRWVFFVPAGVDCERLFSWDVFYKKNLHRKMDVYMQSRNAFFEIEQTYTLISGNDSNLKMQFQAFVYI